MMTNTKFTAALTAGVLAITGCGGGGSSKSSTTGSVKPGSSTTGTTHTGGLGGVGTIGGTTGTGTTGTGTTGTGTTGSTTGTTGTGGTTGGSTNSGNTLSSLLNMLMGLLGGTGGSSNSGMSSILNLIMSLLGGGSSSSSGNNSMVTSLLNMLLSMIGGSSSSSGSGASSIINQILQMLAGGTGSSTGTGGTTSSGGTTSTGGTSSSGGSTSTGGTNNSGVPYVAYPYTADLSQAQPVGVYVNGAYSASGNGWYGNQITNGPDVVAMGDNTNGYPGDCSDGANANDPEVLWFGSFDFSRITANDLPVARFDTWYDTQGTDGGIFIVYDLTTGQTDTPDPYTGSYDVPLTSPTGGVLAGYNQQSMGFDLSSYAGSPDPIMIGIYFQSSSGSGYAPGYWAIGDVFVGHR